MLPLEWSDRIAAFEIVVPFLLGQIAAVFRYYGEDTRHPSRPLNLPPWVVLGPPIIVTVTLVLLFTCMAVGGISQAEWTPAPDQFKGLLTFCVGLLNASTVYVISKYFQSAGPSVAVVPTTDQDATDY